MSRDPQDWRIEKFESLGFTYHEALALARSKDAKGVHVYWGDVQKALELGADHAKALELYVEDTYEQPSTALVYVDD